MSALLHDPREVGMFNPDIGAGTRWKRGSSGNPAALPWHITRFRLEGEVGHRIGRTVYTRCRSLSGRDVPVGAAGRQHRADVCQPISKPGAVALQYRWRDGSKRNQLRGGDFGNESDCNHCDAKDKHAQASAAYTMMPEMAALLEEVMSHAYMELKDWQRLEAGTSLLKTGSVLNRR